jgi:hypothetical protein
VKEILDLAGSVIADKEGYSGHPVEVKANYR